MSLESAYSLIEKLVKDFNANEKHYLASDYSESQARLDFIDKLFIALGWDVNHEHQKNPYEQEVKVERRVKDKETQKRADYAFFLSPNYRDPKFYVEAKKPSRSLANPYDYFQAIRYGWNAQTPLVVLTDFEEFHILDSRYKPDIKYTKERKVLSFHYTEYTDKEKFSKLYYLFSREAVESGSIEKFAETMPKPRGKAVQKGLFPGSYQSIDESFLEELDEIRNTLARSFKKKNPALTSEELTEATQRTIDRLVFIRFLEDMLIEGEHHISSYGDKGTAWGDFIADCRSLNAKYNGIVFKEHFIDRTNIPPLFKGGQNRAVSTVQGGSLLNPPDDKDFGDICEELSHINSPYNFNSIPIHILGSIYERFLGKVVHATEKRVTIEEKPEVRKAGGVYYTPQYIVQYIVDNTVGKLIEGKTPAEISKLRFADISCGSGSFLITVYDTLLRYHSKYYQLNPKEAKADGCIFSNGLWVLSLKQKRQILLNNVYGVDIDHQAVEVTQLSLYLKLLEDETLASIQQEELFYKKKILPDLSKNIHCANSLISRNSLFSIEEEKKINPINFDEIFTPLSEFKGFDVIVGNPPYIEIQKLASIYPKETKYIKSNYLTAKNSNFDIYVCFIERALKLLSKNGYLGYICPNRFFTSEYGRNLTLFLKNYCIDQITNFKHYFVFENADTYTTILFIANKPQEKNIKYIEFNNIYNTNHDKIKTIIESKEISKYKSIDVIDASFKTIFPWYLMPRKERDLYEKLDVSRIKFRDLYNEFFVGVQTSSDEIFILKKENGVFGKNEFYSKFLKTKVLIEDDIMLPLISDPDINRYHINFKSNFILFPYNKNGSLYTEKVLKSSFPLAYNYLLNFKKKLESRENNKFKDESWYRFGRNQNVDKQLTIKILLPHVIQKMRCAYDEQGKYAIKNVGANGIHLKDNDYYNPYFVTAILNSNIASYVISKISIFLSGGFYAANKQFSSLIPFPDNQNIQLNDEVTIYAKQLIEVKKCLFDAQTDKDITFYEKKCNSLERQIDRLVYELYGLTEDEIKIVEGE